MAIARGHGRLKGKKKVKQENKEVVLENLVGQDCNLSTSGGKAKGWRVKIPVCLATEYVPDQFRGGGRGEEKGILSSSCFYDLRTKLNILRKK